MRKAAELSFLRCGERAANDMAAPRWVGGWWGARCENRT